MSTQTDNWLLHSQKRVLTFSNISKKGPHKFYLLTFLKITLKHKLQIESADFSCIKQYCELYITRGLKILRKTIQSKKKSLLLKKQPDINHCNYNQHEQAKSGS